MLASSIPTRVPKLPADLKCDRRLSRAGRHRKEDATLAGNNRFNGAIDRNFLIIAFALPQREVDWREKLLGGRITGQRFALAKSLPQRFGRGIRFNLCFLPREIVELNCFRAVCGISELQSEHLGVLFCLLKAFCGRLVFWFRFDDRQRRIASVSENVIDSFRRSTDKTFPDGNDSPVGYRSLLSYGIRLVIPTCSLKLRHDELATRIRFGWHEARKIAEI